MMDSAKETLLRFFGEFREEMRTERYGSMFVRPPYFDELEATRNCVLSGGRGTGKTTVLRSLSYQALHQQNPTVKLPFFGLYMKMNKNHVSALQGLGHPDDHWQRVFSHYFNLLACLEITLLAQWLEKHEHWTPFTAEEFAPSLQRLGIAKQAKGAAEALELIDTSLGELELYINNPHRLAVPILSLAEKPVRLLATVIYSRPESLERPIFCCIDEYENLMPLQQATVNTFIKHADKIFAYKVGVRRDGFKTLETINQDDKLCYPDDYDLIDITTEVTQEFMIEVVDKRLGFASRENDDIPSSMRELLQDLTRSEEALLLGAQRVADIVLDEVKKDAPQLLQWCTSMGADLYLAKYISMVQKSSAVKVVHEWFSAPRAMETRIGNYGYASLFWLSLGRKGARIRKHYCGQDTFLLLASGNIRYLLELIDESVSNFFLSERAGGGVRIRLSAKAQTEAAIIVGRRRLDALDGYSFLGRDLRHLILGIGAVFSELARSPVGSAPEQNMFVISGAPESIAVLQPFLDDGIVSQSLEKSPRTKATAPSQMRADEYRLHPIFSAFFAYSHRKKRCVTFPADLLIQIINGDSNKAIRSLLDRGQAAEPQDETHERNLLAHLPPQLALFTDFFGEG